MAFLEIQVDDIPADGDPLHGHLFTATIEACGVHHPRYMPWRRWYMQIEERCAQEKPCGGPWTHFDLKGGAAHALTLAGAFNLSHKYTYKLWEDIDLDNGLAGLKRLEGRD